MADRGLTLWTWTPDGYSTASSDAALSAIASLGANQVVLVPTWFQSGIKANCFAPDPGFTPNDASVVHAMQQAHRLGLAVTIKPQVNLADGGWRGYIQPSDPAAWFGCYARFLDHYAALAQANGANRLVIGTELAGVSEYTAAWQALIAGARARFHGLLTYAALPFEYPKIAFWGRLDEIGVDAYWPLATAPTANVAQLQAAWAPIADQLAAASARWRRPVLFTEAGYASQGGTATDPSSWTLSSTPAPEQQAAAYQALLATFSGKPWFAGVDWWAWRATDDSPSLDFTPQGKPAAQVLRSWWAPAAG
ncbi:MAG: glycoside hydrolase family 113 [Mycobacteriales bacterium]